MEFKKITVNEAKDTGLALILILLLIAKFGNKDGLILPAIIVLILTMTWPRVFKPLAHVWFGFSHILGGFVSKVLLTVIFFVVATPIGMIVRLTGVDSMRFKAWKRGDDSIFVKRDHVFSARDLERPY